MIPLRRDRARKLVKQGVRCASGDPHNTRRPPTQCADLPQAAVDVLYVRTHGALGFQRPFGLRCARSARDLMIKFISNAEFLVPSSFFQGSTRLFRVGTKNKPIL